jgi:beta-lactamase superfamily II metal-dependent hydrolase
LLESLQPRLGCISVGARNSFGHPDPTTLQGLEQAGVQLIRTDLSGAVVIPLSRSAASGRDGPGVGGTKPLATGSPATVTKKGTVR